MMMRLINTRVVCSPSTDQKNGKKKRERKRKEKIGMIGPPKEAT